MSFSQMTKDTLVLVKTDGSRTEGIKGSVQKNKIFLFRNDIHIEPGDELHRLMPGNKYEEYIVKEPNFYQGTHGIPPNYQAEVVRKSQQSLNSGSVARSEGNSPSTTTNYNFYGSHSRVNNHSIDNSYNSSASSDEIRQAMESLKSARQEVNQLSELTESDKKTTDATLAAIETQLQVSEPSKPVIKAVMGALPEVVKYLPSIMKLVEIFKD